MKKIFILFTFFILIKLVNAKENRLLIFAGAASKPATEAIIKDFEKETNIKVDINFGGSGVVLSQMILSQSGDIYFPGSSDYMELAKEKNLIVANSEKKIVYLVNAIAVQKGNPKNIQSLKDLCKDNLKISIANPDNVCVGSYAVEIIEKNLNKQEKEKIRKNIVNYAKSCESTATSISFKTVDAIIGWSAFGDWDPSKIEIIPLKSEEIIRVGYIPIAISKFSKNPENAKKFIDFMLKEKSKEYFRKFGYFMSKEEAFSYIGKKPVGGTYELPNDWK